jgi:hypothetical protein
LIIQNSIPTFTGISLNQTSYYANESIKAIPTGFSDLDGDSANFSYQWFVDGKKVLSGTGLSQTLNKSYYLKNQLVKIVVWAYDGRVNSSSNITQTITIRNFAPKANVQFTQQHYDDRTNIGLTISNWIDIDVNDSQFVYIEWYRNGVPITSVINQTMISHDLYQFNDQIDVKITLNDGQENGTIFSQKFTIEYSTQNISTTSQSSTSSSNTTSSTATTSESSNNSSMVYIVIFIVIGGAIGLIGFAGYKFIKRDFITLQDKKKK